MCITLNSGWTYLGFELFGSSTHPMINPREQFGGHHVILSVGQPKIGWHLLTKLSNFCFLTNVLKCLDRTHNYYFARAMKNMRKYKGRKSKFFKLAKYQQDFLKVGLSYFFTILITFCFLDHGPKMPRQVP